jgi:CDGSH-type Zn-finger protein
MASEKPGDRKIVIAANGPYLVYGAVPLDVQAIAPNAEGGSWTWEAGRSFERKDVYALCRCGHSATKPFCDGTHAKIGFDGTETAARSPFDGQVTTIEGERYDLLDAEPLCAFARFCDNDGGIWDLVGKSADPAVAALVVHEEGHCPSGRLVLRGKGGGQEVEPEFAPSVVLVEDPAKDSSGPVWVRGGIPIESQDGTPYEVRNRQTLCRCGASSNKPFCDGAHVDVGFKDGLG